MSYLKISVINFHGARLLVGPGTALFAAGVLLSLRYGLFPCFLTVTLRSFWLMAFWATLGILGSLVLHDMAHMVAARFLGVRPKNRFYMFGDIENGDEPRNRKKDWKIALAGPIASLMLGLTLCFISYLTDIFGFEREVVSVLFHVAAMNLTLAFLNFLPCFPLDGGRVMRAWMWEKRSFLKANTMVTRSGICLSIILIFVGLVSLFNGKTISGCWIIAVGLAIGFSALASREAVFVRTALKGQPVTKIMNRLPLCVSPYLSVQALIDEYINVYGFPVYPVLRDGQPIGYVSKKEISKTKRSFRSLSTVGDILCRLSAKNSVGPDTPALKVLDQMEEENLPMMIVMENDRLFGIVTYENIRCFSALQEERLESRAQPEVYQEKRRVPKYPHRSWPSLGFETMGEQPRIFRALPYFEYESVSR